MKMEVEVKKVVKAFRAGEMFFGKFAKTDGKVVWVNSKKIAWKEPDGSIGAMIAGFA